MINLRRRDFLFAFSAGLLSPTSILADASDYEGCCLSLDQFNTVHSSSSRLAAMGTPDLIPSSGDKTLDRAIGITVSRVSREFDVHPGFGFIDDQLNAFASPEPLVPGTRGTVYFGMPLLRRQLKVAPSGVAVMGVIAHEFGHIAQFDSGLHSRLSRGQPTVRLVELHADYLAGFYAGTRARTNKALHTDDLGDAFFSIGDTQFSNRQHHGTPSERVQALTQGFRFGKSNGGGIRDALTSGETAIRRI
jgi:hypothetical protein